jgi:hypothetical protein
VLVLGWHATSRGGSIACDKARLVVTGRTTLHAAAGNGHSRTVKALLAAGADASMLDDQGETARQLAFRRGHTAVVAALRWPSRPRAAARWRFVRDGFAAAAAFAAAGRAHYQRHEGEIFLAAGLSGAALVDFCCPVTKEVMKDPVVAADGHSYERCAIEAWLRRSRLSPATGAAMQAAGRRRQVLPNHTLRRVICDTAERGRTAFHASLRTRRAQQCAAQQCTDRHSAAAVVMRAMRTHVAALARQKKERKATLALLHEPAAADLEHGAARCLLPGGQCVVLHQGGYLIRAATTTTAVPLTNGATRLRSAVTNSATRDNQRHSAMHRCGRRLPRHAMHPPDSRVACAGQRAGQRAGRERGGGLAVRPGPMSFGSQGASETTHTAQVIEGLGAGESPDAYQLPCVPPKQLAQLLAVQTAGAAGGARGSMRLAAEGKVDPQLGFEWLSVLHQCLQKLQANDGGGGGGCGGGGLVPDPSSMPLRLAQRLEDDLSFEWSLSSLSGAAAYLALAPDPRALVLKRAARNEGQGLLQKGAAANRPNALGAHQPLAHSPQHASPAVQLWRPVQFRRRCVCMCATAATKEEAIPKPAARRGGGQRGTAGVALALRGDRHRRHH